MPALYTLLGLFIGIVAGWLAAAWWRRRAAQDPIRKHPRGMEERDPYRLNPGLLTRPEEAFYHTLCAVVPTGYTVLAKVRMADLFQVTYGARDRGEAHARIGNKGLDFVVCDASLAPRIAITLQGDVADRAEVQTRNFIARVCAKVGLPLVQMPVAVQYAADEVERAVAPYFCAERMAA